MKCISSMIKEITAPTKFKVFRKNVLYVPDKNLGNNSFTVKSMGLDIKIICHELNINKIQVINIRIVVNECVTSAIDFTLDYLIHNEGRCDRLLLEQLFTTKTIKQIMLDL